MDRRRAPVFGDGPHPGRRRRDAPAWQRVAGVAVLGITLVAGSALTRPGEALALAGYHFLEFYTGVFALVAFSLTVMAGFFATDRIVLLPRHRVSLQTAHRLTAILGVSCLAIHICLKVAEGHVSVVGALVPFAAPDRRLFIGLGVLACYLFALLIWTGLTRARFADSSRPWVWRTVHVSAYPAWLFSILHGLVSGRHPATWVTVSYVLCVVVVLLGVVVRTAASWGRRGAGRTAASIRAVPATVRAPIPLTVVMQPGRLGPPDPAYPPPPAPPAAPAPPVSPLLPPRPVPVPPPAVPPVPPQPRPVPARSPMRAGRPAMGLARQRDPLRAGSRRRGRSMESLSDDEFWRHMKGESGR